MKRPLRFVPALCCAAVLAMPACGAEPADPQAQRQAVLRLAPALKDLDIEKVRAAVDALASTGSPLAAPYLWQLYEAGDGRRRRMALLALKQLRPEGYTERLYQAALADALVSIRKLAAEVCAHVAGRNAAAERFMQGYGDTKKINAIGRLRTVQLLGRIGGKGVPEFLAGLLADKDSDVAAASAEALAELGDLAHALPLIAQLNHPDPEVRPSIAESLANLTGQKNGFDRVKWEQWLADYKAGKFKDAAETQEEVVISFSDQAYKNLQQKEREHNPFLKPLRESGVDVAVIFDTTGSMTHIWPELSNAIDSVLREIEKQTPAPRMGGVRYRAADPRQTYTYLIQPKPLTRKMQDARDFMLDASFGGGSGGLHLGIRHAISSFAWRANARKMILLVGDTTPTAQGLDTCLGMIMEGYEQDGIIFNALFVRTIHGDEHKSTYGHLAAAGAGRFYEYNKAWKHLVDVGVEKPDPKKTELPTETWEKWLTPAPRKR